MTTPVELQRIVLSVGKEPLTRSDANKLLDYVAKGIQIERIPAYGINEALVATGDLKPPKTRTALRGRIRCEVPA